MYHQFGFEEEREALFSRFSEVGLSYMTLKGLRFADLYPMPGMRSMSDLDILFGYVEEKEDGRYGFAGRTKQNMLCFPTRLWRRLTRWLRIWDSRFTKEMKRKYRT